MEWTSNIWWWNRNHKSSLLFDFAVRAKFRLEKSLFLPPLVPPGFNFVRIIGITGFSFSGLPSSHQIFLFLSFLSFSLSCKNLMWSASCIYNQCHTYFCAKETWQTRTVQPVKPIVVLRKEIHSLSVFSFPLSSFPTSAFFAASRISGFGPLEAWCVGAVGSPAL